MAKKKKAAKKKAAKRKAPRKAVRRKATKRKAARRKAPKRKAARRKAPKKAARKKATRKKVVKKAKRKASKRKPNAAFMRPLTPTGPLAEVIGSAPVPRTAATSKIWAYIKRHGLQDSVNRRNINADDKLRALFAGRGQVTMFELTKYVSKYLQ